MTTEADVARLSDEQILRFVMEPGFSDSRRDHEHLRPRCRP